MIEAVSSISGNIKFAMDEGGANSIVALSSLSIGDMNTHDIACDTFVNITVDTEAMDMDKATIDSYRYQVRFIIY